MKFKRLNLTLRRNNTSWETLAALAYSLPSIHPKMCSGSKSKGIHSAYPELNIDRLLGLPLSLHALEADRADLFGPTGQEICR